MLFRSSVRSPDLGTNVLKVCCPDAPCCEADASRQRRSETCPEVDPAAHAFFVPQLCLTRRLAADAGGAEGVSGPRYPR
jgi:hypothetical protein